ncbi:trimeric LpxA-like protein [Entophlyctis helioformis]|nr:trimeric LpxA-like protein [Entophlyctis helioformis]
MAGSSNTVCANVRIQGPDIDLGTNNVFQPLVRILQEDGAGPIVMGSNNIFEEQVTVINSGPAMLFIGDNNLFSTGSTIRSKYVGNNCTVSAKAVLHPDSSIQDNCVIGPRCIVAAGETVPENTVMYGTGDHVSRTRAKPLASQILLHPKHVEYLKDVLPKYHAT